jgi:hypothetical protein
LLVGCSRKANSFTLPVSFSAAQLIITHFRSNSSFPTSIAATSSAATTTTTMTTTYDQEVVVFLAVKKDHHTSKINSCRHLLQNPKPYADTHTEKGKLQQKKKKQGTQQAHKSGSRQENQVNERLFTKQQQQSYHNRNQAKQASA